jgi:hypothetical protein
MKHYRTLYTVSSLLGLVLLMLTIEAAQTQLSQTSCAPALKRLGNSPHGNKLSAKFPGPDFPDQVTVNEAPSDTQPIRGSSGVWISGNTYTDLAVTLVLIKNGAAVEVCSYDEAGNLAQSDAAVNSFTLSASGGTVTFSWESTIEVGVTVYPIDRKPDGGVYEEGVAADFPDTRPVPKTYPNPASGIVISDTPPVSGNYVYRLRARFEDGSSKILAESEVIMVQ